MSRLIQDTAAAALTSTTDLTTVPLRVFGWVRPRHALIWGELRSLGKQIFDAPEPEPKPARRPELRFVC